MTNSAGEKGPKIVATIILGVAVINLLFLLTEITLNVLGVMLPL